MDCKNLLFYSSLALGVAVAINSGVAVANVPVTPIKHLIVVVGENVTFDTLFATYKPADPTQSINNLLAKGIVTAAGGPGAHYALAQQMQASNDSGVYTLHPVVGAPYAALPQPYDTGILDPTTFQYVAPAPDQRFPSHLANGPFQITRYVPYGSLNSTTGDPVHRFFQMWQQTGGSNHNLGLFTWVATTIGTGGDNGVTGPSLGNPQQGGELMGFFNMAAGDAPVFKQLADTYALSDNYHQAIMGGTGVNFFAIATGDVAVYNKAGVLAKPYANQIENPRPEAGTNNFYIHDGYSGGSYVNCSDPKQPGVPPILQHLKQNNLASNCAAGAYYLVNNYDAPYNVDGTAKPLGATSYVYPPQSVPTIGEALSANQVTWRWYTAGRDSNDILNDSLYPLIYFYANLQVPITIPEPTRSQMVAAKAYALTQTAIYNSLGDPHNASANVVKTPLLRRHLKGMDTFVNDLANHTLPAVSFVVPKNLDSGHPGYSAPMLYEQFISDLVAKVQAQPSLWANTAILVTTDEGGGYFDSGLIQTLDFFGDGPRIPMLVVSPYAKKGYVDHAYHDHASILKFIEYNWGISPLSKRSRDNLPNPVATGNAYIPSNRPAIGDLTTLFNFPAK